MQYPETIASALDALLTGAITSEELVEASLERSEQFDDLLGVFLHQDAEQARAAAKAVDLRRRAGETMGPLAGIPLGVKDNILTADAPTTAQSSARDPIESDDAPIVARLRQAEAVIMGKTTTLEFALGFNDPDKPFPIPRNPWNVTHWTGGSSSGTASGTQAGMFLGGLGTDTAGSIRMPAAWCGISGHKPTFGLVPRTGVLPLGWTLDHAGPLARTAEDCAILLSVIAGPDGEDRSVRDQVSFDFAEVELDFRGLRVGIAQNPMSRSVTGVQRLVLDAGVMFESLGARVFELELPVYEEVVDSVMLGLSAEAFAYHRPEAINRWHDYGRSTRSALLTGALLSSTDYLQTLRVRRFAQRRLEELFENVDLIIAPTATQSAPRLDRLDFQEVVGMLQTHYWNGTGHPALSVPMGSVDGLPVGLQIVGRPFADQQVLDAGRIWQRHTDYHTQVVPL